MLGNIKGTFGFVDATGEVKRVTYSSANGTGFKSTTVSPLQEQISVVQNMPRYNRTATTKKPNVLFTGSTESATKSTVVQPIPRTRKLTTASSISSSTESSTENPPRPSFLRPKGKHRFIINGQQRPIVLEEEEIEEDTPTTKSSSSDKSPALRKVIFTKRPLEHNLRPITEEFEDKEEEPKITTGNALRRQLPEETTKATPVVEEDNDHADVYGGALSTNRPLFTTTTPARIVPRVADLRQERQQKHVYINRDTGPAKFESSSRAYEQQETKNHAQEDRNTAQQVIIRTTTRPPADGRDYVRQTVEPGYLRQQPESYLREITPGGIIVPAPGNNLEEEPGYRPIPLSRLLLRPDLARLQPLYTGANQANVHYLTDSPPAAQEHEEAAPRTPVPVTPVTQGYSPRQRAAYQRLQYPEGIDPRGIDPRVVDPRVLDPRRPILRQGLQPLPQDEREYQNIASDYPYRANQLALPPEPPNPIAPPLSRRDFQILLRRLLISQYGIQALNYPKAYLEDALYDQQPYPTYQPAYQAPIPRPEAAYPGEPVGPGPVGPGPVAPLPYSERVPLRRASMYSRAINPLYQANQYEEYPDDKYQKRVYRQKFYTPEVTDDGEEILPPQIREALLLRMLQLAISAERPLAMTNSMVMAAPTQPTTRYRKGPVRSVQILGEDADEEKETRKKM